MKEVSIQQFLGIEAPCLDIRSPGEFAKGHLPQAISFPLFDDEERARVGTCYKQEGPNQAVKLGLDIVGPKMSRLVAAAEAMNTKHLKLYCWRGGMRSESMAWLLSRVGIRCDRLSGGYKAYRSFLLQQIERTYDLRVLTGMTGSGKTEILRAMQHQGAQVLDLEGLANHPGSSFGNALHLEQPTTEMFQNNLMYQLSRFDPARPIWIEDESITIGQVHLPEVFFKKMGMASTYVIDTPLSVRVKLLVEQYGEIPTENLIQATLAIQKKLGVEATERAIDCIESGALEEAVQHLLTYYDRQYHKSLQRKNNYHVAATLTCNGDFAETARQLLHTYGN